MGGSPVLRVAALATRGGHARACSRVCAWLTWEKSLRIEVVALANSGPLEFSRGSANNCIVLTVLHPGHPDAEFTADAV